MMCNPKFKIIEEMQIHNSEVYCSYKAMLDKDVDFEAKDITFLKNNPDIFITAVAIQNYFETEEWKHMSKNWLPATHALIGGFKEKSNRSQLSILDAPELGSLLLGKKTITADDVLNDIAYFNIPAVIVANFER